jgi:hypothetical protein
MGCGHLPSCLDRMFFDQDKVPVESTIPSRKRLSRTDVTGSPRANSPERMRQPPGERTLKLDLA